MIVMTNCRALRNSAQILKELNSNFVYGAVNAFKLVNGLPYKPDILITDHYEEAKVASKQFPTIKFVGPNMSFPNYSRDIPEALLDEVSLAHLPKDDVCPQPKIAYANFCGPSAKPFIWKLKGLGLPLKVVGPAYCHNELDRNFPQRSTPHFYRDYLYIGCTSREEYLKALYMGKVVIRNFDGEYGYHIDDLDSLDNLKVQDGQVEWAAQFSHLNFYRKLFDETGN